MFNAKFSSADEVYESIYKQAKSSIYVVDNYIGLRTLVHLKNSPTGVAIILFSDNVGNNKLHNIEFTDFCKEYPTVNLSLKKTGGIFHDRFIVLDYGTADERVFLCGASSKDAGARITSIVEDYGISKYAPVIATLLKNPTLILPQYRGVNVLKKKTKCYIYTRVSTVIQVDGYSLDAQKDKLKKYAEFQDMMLQNLESELIN